MRTPFVALAAALSLCSVLAACGGGGGGSPLPVQPSPTPAATATPTPSPSPTSSPATQTATVPVTAAATNAPIPAVAGFSGSVSLPASNASGTASITATSTTSAPGGLPVLQARTHHVATFASSDTVYLYESFTPSATITFNAIPGFSLTLPSSVSTTGQQFYMALFAPGMTQWQMAAQGPAQVSGQTLTFPGQSGTPITLTAGQTYWFAFYSTSTATATPTPAPSPTPTATPTPAATKINLSPSSLSVQTYHTATFSASETGYTGAFTAQVNNSSCYVWATNSTNSTGGSSATAADGNFSLVAADATGCTIAVSDANNNVATLPVTVAAPPFGVAPTSLSLTGTGAPNKQPFTITGGTGPYKVTGYDNTVISVSAEASSSTVYDVTPLKAGQTTITVSDSTGASSTIAVTITTVSGVIQ